jgi:hypothetical protein
MHANKVIMGMAIQALMSAALGALHIIDLTPGQQAITGLLCLCIIGLSTLAKHAKTH